MRIIPTIFALSKNEFKERFERVVPICKEIQIDFMDGDFVKAKGVSLEDVPDLRKMGKKFEAHLMVSNPEEWISDLKKKGFWKAIVHFESAEYDELIEIIDMVKENKMEAWIAINPDSDISEIIDFLKLVKGVLFMGVVPGKEGQKFILPVLEKIKKLRKMNKKIKIQVDGGVNLEVIKILKKAKVDIVNVGGFVGKAENPKSALAILKREIR